MSGLSEGRGAELHTRETSAGQQPYITSIPSQTRNVTDTIDSQSAGSIRPKGLPARALGIVFSPRSTYADVAARPRAAGALLTVIAISALSTFVFLSTEVGRNAALDQQLSAMESFGLHPTAEQLAQIERRAPSGPYFAIAAQIVAIPLVSLMVAGVGLGVFTGALGGAATFKQVYAVVAHSWFIPALTTPLVLPLNYARESLSSTTSLAVFFPMLDEASFVGRLLGSIDLLRLWWTVSLAIGFGVLYNRRTGPIAIAMLAMYAAIALVVAGLLSTISGA
jgi:hypothetical protein